MLPNLARAMGFVWQEARGWSIAWFILLIIQGLLPAVMVSLTRLLVDSLVVVIDSGGSIEGIRSSLVLAIVMGVLLLLMQLLSSLTNWIRTVQVELVKDHVTSLIHIQSVKLDLGFYDSHEYFDHLHRARNEALYRPVYLLDNLGSLLQNSITLIAMFAILIPYGIWIPLMLLLSTLPALTVVLHYSWQEYEWRRRTTPDRRRSRYYSIMQTARESAAELRLFDLGATSNRATRESGIV
ncbi:MAG: hypothetical protein BMS9Abin02_2057 [Anaerolineae bacterium]|nr:MAG: hypothetical protein BMS9Abin02_2057 [Anaerolineae bacterium]